VKKAIPIILLAIVLTASLAILVGCGGSSSNSSGGLNDAEKAVDNAMREAMKGNNQPLLDMVPAELRDQYAQMLQQEGAGLTGAKIEEVHYRTDQTDDTHVTVYYWGVITLPDGQQQTLTEDQPQAMPLVKQDGQWFFDFGSTATEGSPTTPQ
jgi:hypothetical protein